MYVQEVEGGWPNRVSDRRVQSRRVAPYAALRVSYILFREGKWCRSGKMGVAVEEKRKIAGDYFAE